MISSVLLLAAALVASPRAGNPEPRDTTIHEPRVGIAFDLPRGVALPLGSDHVPAAGSLRQRVLRVAPVSPQCSESSEVTQPSSSPSDEMSAFVLLLRSTKKNGARRRPGLLLGSLRLPGLRWRRDRPQVLVNLPLARDQTPATRAASTAPPDTGKESTIRRDRRARLPRPEPSTRVWRWRTPCRARHRRGIRSQLVVSIPGSPTRSAFDLARDCPPTPATATRRGCPRAPPRRVRESRRSKSARAHALRDLPTG